MTRRSVLGLIGLPRHTAPDETGCGWPAFLKPILAGQVPEHHVATLGMVRTEARSSDGDSHLGPVFADGRQDADGRRYCINSASLLLVPKAEMKAQAYGANPDQVEAKS